MKYSVFKTLKLSDLAVFYHFVFENLLLKHNSSKFIITYKIMLKHFVVPFKYHNYPYRAREHTQPSKATKKPSFFVIFCNISSCLCYK
jgi:hypothetical protein